MDTTSQAKGIFTLAVNIKKTIHLTPKIPIQDRGKSRSRSHYRQNSRRSRVRGYILVYKMSSWDLLSWHSAFLMFLIGNLFHAAQLESLLSDKKCWINLPYIISGVFFLHYCKHNDILYYMSHLWYTHPLYTFTLYCIQSGLCHYKILVFWEITRI